MARGFRKRHVEAPDGTRWVVERHWLARRPRYIGFRFGVNKGQPAWEQPLVADGKLPEIRKSRSRRVPGPKVYRDSGDIVRAERARRRWRRRSRRGGSSWLDWFPWSWGGGSPSGGRSGGRLSWGGRSSGGGTRGSSGGGIRSLSSGGGGRGGDGGSGGDGDWDDVLGWIVVAILVIVAALVIVFVVLPAVLFLAGYLLFWLLVGGWILYNTLTGRPWVVKATRDGYEEPDYAYRVKGWRHCQALIDDIADDIRRGEPPTPSEIAVPVELIED